MWSSSLTMTMDAGGSGCGPGGSNCGQVLDGGDGRKEEVHAPADGDEAPQVVHAAVDRAFLDGEVLGQARRRRPDRADDRVGVGVELVEPGEIGPRVLD